MYEVNPPKNNGKTTTNKNIISKNVPSLFSARIVWPGDIQVSFLVISPSIVKPLCHHDLPKVPSHYVEYPLKLSLVDDEAVLVK